MKALKKVPTKINWKSYQKKVYDCIQQINKEVKKMDKHIGNSLKDKIIDIIIADQSKKFGLKSSNMRLIYYGRSPNSDINHVQLLNDF